MTSQAEIIKTDMEFMDIPRTGLKVSRVAIGTWAIGGWMWGEPMKRESIATIRAAIDHGINVIDTAPAYGFGRVRRNRWQGRRARTLECGYRNQGRT